MTISNNSESLETSHNVADDSTDSQLGINSTHFNWKSDEVQTFSSSMLNSLGSSNITLDGYDPNSSPCYTYSSSTGSQINVDKILLGGTDLGTVLADIQKRLSILVPDPELLEKYQALQAAYNHYKTLEALCYQESKHE